MVKAGAPTDAVIGEFAPLLEPGDMIVDGGASHNTWLPEDMPTA